MYRKIYNLLLTIFFLFVTQANITSVHAEDNPSLDEWIIVGQANLSVLWFDVYDATLLTSSGRFDGYASPLILKLHYLRDISKQALLKETEKQLSKFESARDVRQQWLLRLRDLWPDIKEGDELVFWVDQSGHSTFLYNQAVSGVISDPRFAHAFIQIWLSEDGEYPELAKRLKGELR